MCARVYRPQRIKCHIIIYASYVIYTEKKLISVCCNIITINLRWHHNAVWGCNWISAAAPPAAFMAQTYVRLRPFHNLSNIFITIYGFLEHYVILHTAAVRYISRDTHTLRSYTRLSDNIFVVCSFFIWTTMFKIVVFITMTGSFKSKNKIDTMWYCVTQ